MKAPAQSHLLGLVRHGALHLDHLAPRHLDLIADDLDVRVLQANKLGRGKAVEVAVGLPLDIAGVDVEGGGELNFVRAPGRILGEVRNRADLGARGCGVRYRHLDGVERSHHPARQVRQAQPCGLLEPRDLDEISVARRPDVVAEGVDALLSVAPATREVGCCWIRATWRCSLSRYNISASPPAKAGDGRHARVVPASDSVGGDELQELAL